MAALVKQSLVDQLYQELRKDIINQEIDWGEKLNVAELQQKFEVSCTPIREALNRLQKEGLVEYKPNFGMRVIDISEEDIIEIQEAAAALDSAAIRYAMKKANLTELARELSEILQAYRDATQEPERARNTEEFMNVFYRYAGNERLISLAQSIKGQQSMLKSIYSKLKQENGGLADHIKIYEAVVAGDASQAVASAEANYTRATELLLLSFTRR